MPGNKPRGRNVSHYGNCGQCGATITTAVYQLTRRDLVETFGDPGLDGLFYFCGLPCRDAWAAVHRHTTREERDELKARKQAAGAK